PGLALQSSACVKGCSMRSTKRTAVATKWTTRGRGKNRPAVPWCARCGLRPVGRQTCSHLQPGNVVQDGAFPAIFQEVRMGLFDFVRDIGKKIFGSDEEAEEKIKAEIESTNPGVSNLGVQ